jgi:hypothetical protein
MIWVTVIVLMMLWTLAMATAHMFGGFIHILLLVALGMSVIKIILGRRAKRWFFLPARSRINDSKSFMLYSKMRW